MTERTRVKICGITRLEDARVSARWGVDSIGLNFHAPSPRFIDLESAIAVRDALPPFVTLTALFLDETEDWVTEVVYRLRPDCLQFHGQESPEFCESWQMPYLKTIPMGSVDDPLDYAAQYRRAQGFLCDSNAAGRLGGSGDTFDWSRIPESFDYPLLLAGGLTPSNVAAAIARTRPWGVDICSGVEVDKGIKSGDLIGQLFREVRHADSMVHNESRVSDGHDG